MLPLLITAAASTPPTGPTSSAPADTDAKLVLAPSHAVVSPKPGGAKTQHKPHQRKRWVPRDQYRRENEQRKADQRPGEAIPLAVRMIALRKTYGNGLASGQILIRTQAGWRLNEKFDFIVSAVFLPGPDDRTKEGVVQDYTAWMPYDEGDLSPRDRVWDILQIKVAEDRLPLVRVCNLEGQVYLGERWIPMTVEQIKLRMCKAEHRQAVQDFTGLEYPAWSHGDHYKKPVFDDAIASTLAQKQLLA